MIFTYGAITRYGLPFQGSWVNQIAYWCALSLAYARDYPYLITPACISLISTNFDEHKRNTNWFELFSFRSPLLRECPSPKRGFFSFPLRTEMFPFRRFASLACAMGFSGSTPERVSPFGDPGFKGCLSPPPGLSQTGCVLHRLPVPRHPPCAYNFTYLG